jgi:pilus assembly protein CpaB
VATLTRIAAALLIVLAVLLGGFAWTLSRRPAPAPQTTLAQRWPVVVATRALPAGKPIPPDALAVESMPVNPNGTFSDPGAIAGRTPTIDIAARAPVFEAQLLTGIAERLQPGERAVAVRVDEANAVGDRVKPGNYVDVFFTLKRDGVAGGPGGGNAEIAQTQARLLMSKVRVLAFGDSTSASNNSNGNGNSTRQRSLTNGPRTAVLAVPVEDVDQLALAEANGHLIFALRNPNDDDVVDTTAFAPYGGVVKTAATGDAGKGGGAQASGSTRAAAGVALADLSGAQGAPGKPLPERAAPRARPVVTAQSGGNIEVIRGGHAETVAW